MKPRHGAASTIVLAAAGLIGLGLAGLSVVTGVTPCSLMQTGSCSTETSEVATASLAADTGSCDSAAKAETVAMSENCAEKTACGEAPEAVTVAASGDCEKASSCGDAGNAMTVAAAGDCSSKSDCGDKAKAVTVAAEGACDSAKSCEGESVQLVAGSSENCSEKTACEDGAKAVTVAAGGDCQKTCDDAAKAQTVAAAGACETACDDAAKAATVADGACEKTCDEGAKAVTVATAGDCEKSCESGAKAQTVAATGDCEKSCEGEAVQVVAASNEGEACGGECAEGDVKALPVAIHAFNDNCPYSGNPAKADVVADYHGMKVNFCCNGCKGRFEKADDAKRLQLVSGVVKPINSECCNKPAKAETMAVVQGFPVAFCKSACAEMVKSADDKKQMAFVASKIKPVNESCCDKPVSEAKMVAFHNGQAVAFYGEGCAENFQNSTDEQKAAHVANLVAGKGAGGDCEKVCAGSSCTGA